MRLDGNPYPVNYTWYQNGVVISDAADRNVMLTANSITFAVLQASNNGTYTVEASNFLGTATASFDLFVYCKSVSHFIYIRVCIGNIAI